MAKSRRPRKPPGDQYKRGYANGVRAAVDMLLGDLETTGRLTVEYDDDGTSTECAVCLLRGQELHHLAVLAEFTRGIKCGPEGTMSP